MTSIYKLLLIASIFLSSVLSQGNLKNGQPCSHSTKCLSNICRLTKCKGKDNGRDCTVKEECASNSCINKKCVVSLTASISILSGISKNVTNLKVGDRCNSYKGCKSGICSGGTCAIVKAGNSCTSSKNCEFGICKGGKCFTLAGKKCSSNIECSSNICFAELCRQPNGMSCTTQSECISYRCINKTCKGRGDGDKADDNRQCASLKRSLFDKCKGD
jgi:hypothetical protein